MEKNNKTYNGIIAFSAIISVFVSISAIAYTLFNDRNIQTLENDRHIQKNKIELLLLRKEYEKHIKDYEGNRDSVEKQLREIREVLFRMEGEMKSLNKTINNNYNNN